jgi:hypothetical protein
MCLSSYLLPAPTMQFIRCFPALLLALLALTVLASLAAPTQAHRAWWPNWGNGPDNRHHAVEEDTISAANVGSLAPVWTRTLLGNVTGPPAVDRDAPSTPTTSPAACGRSTATPATSNGAPRSCVGSLCSCPTWGRGM